MAEIEAEDRRITVTARRAEGEERERLYARFIGQNAGAVTTRRLTERVIPVFVLEPEALPGQPPS